MSKTVELELNCPRCRTFVRATLYRTIWVENPENMKLIENDQINLVHCAACGLSEMPPFPFVATNVEKKIALWYEPIPDRNIDSDIASYKEHYGADCVYARAERISDWKDFKSRLAQLNNLPDVVATMEDLVRLQRGMQSAYAQQRKLKDAPRNERLAKAIDRLRKCGHNIPTVVAELPNFPCSNFVNLKKRIYPREFALYCPTSSYNPSIANTLAKRSEKFTAFVATAMMYVIPIVFIILAMFVFWGWALLSPLVFFSGYKLTKSTYRKILFRSATESESEFCFLFYSYKIGVAVLPDMGKVYVWQRSHP